MEFTYCKLGIFYFNQNLTCLYDFRFIIYFSMAFRMAASEEKQFSSTGAFSY